MKVSTILTVFAVGLAVLASGCRYNKGAKGGAGDGASDINIGNASVQDINSSAQGGSLSDLSEGKFEDLYKRCTDVSFSPVYFGFDSTVVPQAELGKIDAVVQHLTARQDRVVVVEGNCDERGSSEYNMSLGQNRSDIIRNYLVQNGIAANRIQTRSYGAEKPAVDGHDESAYSKNRRGEFAIYQK